MNAVYTLAEVAECLKCSRSIVKQLIEDGRLAASDLSSPKSSHRNYRVSQAALDQYITTPVEAKQRKTDQAKPVIGKPFMKCMGAKQ